MHIVFDLYHNTLLSRCLNISVPQQPIIKAQEQYSIHNMYGCEHYDCRT